MIKFFDIFRQGARKNVRHLDGSRVEMSLDIFRQRHIEKKNVFNNPTF